MSCGHLERLFVAMTCYNNSGLDLKKLRVTQGYP